MKQNQQEIIQSILRDLISEARMRKRRVKMRLENLRTFGLRGPSNHNWLFYKRSVENHKKSAERVNAVFNLTKIK